MTRKLRAIIGTFVFVALTLALYYIFWFLSNIGNKPDEPNSDISGYPAILLGFCFSPLTLLLDTYIRTGKPSLWGPEDISLVTASQIPPPSIVERPPNKKNTFVILTFLTLTWLLAAGYCQLLLASIKASITDKTIIDIELPAEQADKFITTLGGTLYMGAFFPLAAICSFLAGWLSLRQLHFWHLLIPALIYYTTLNIIALAKTGHFQVVSAIARGLKKASEDNVIPKTDGDSTLIGIVAFLLFCVLVLLLALYGWMWTAIGRSVKRRFHLRV